MTVLIIRINKGFVNPGLISEGCRDWQKISSRFGRPPKHFLKSKHVNISIWVWNLSTYPKYPQLYNMQFFEILSLTSRFLYTLLAFGQTHNAKELKLTDLHRIFLSKRATLSKQDLPLDWDFWQILADIPSCSTHYKDHFLQLLQSAVFLSHSFLIKEIKKSGFPKPRFTNP